MSRSPTETRDVTPYEQGWQAISRLIREDGSWSSHERNIFYLNHGDGTFLDASGISGVDFPDDGRAFVSFDFDQDGDLDLALKSRDEPQLRLLRNDVGNGKPAVTLWLEGRRGNRDAVGARVEVHAARGVMQKSVRAASGYLSQSSRRLHFGLDGRGEIDKLVIHWPSGDTQTLTSVPKNHLVRIIEGGDSFEARPFVPAVAGPVPDVTGPTLPPRRGTWLLDPIVAPDFSLEDVNGNPHRLASRKGQRVLLNFWATWCPPCRAELLDLQQGWRGLQSAGVQVMAVSVDEPPARDVVRGFAKELGLDLPLLLATEEMIGVYNVVHRNLFDRQSDLAIPTSFLIDESGRIVKIYRGATDIAEIREDASHIPQSPEERVSRGLPFGGYTLAGDFLRNDLALANAFAERGYWEQAKGFYARAIVENPRSAKVRYNLGTAFLKERRFAEAAQAFQKAIEIAPTMAEAFNNLGYVHAAVGQTAMALEAYRRALELRPYFPEAQNNLGTLEARLGNLADAVAAFEAAVAYRPDFVAAQINLGTALDQAGRSQEAMVPLETAFQLAPSPEICARLVKVSARAGELSRARSHLKAGLDRWSKDPNLLKLAAELDPPPSK